MPEETAVIEAPAAPAKPTGRSETVESPKQTPAEKQSFDAGMKIFGEVMAGKLAKVKPVQSAEPEQPPKPGKDKEEGKGADDKSQKPEPAKPEDEKLPEDVPPADHKPKAKKKPAARPTQPVDEERMAEIAAEAAARASTNVIERMEAEKAKEKPAKPEAEVFTPPSEYEDRFETFKVLAKLKPQYKEIVSDFKRFVKEESDYIEQWKRANPGQPWDGEAEEHNAFYDAATPVYDEHDFHRAEIQKEVADTKKEIRKEVLEEVQPRLAELDELKRNEALRALEPQVSAAARTTVGSILKAIDPALEKFVAPEELPKLREENELAYDVVVEVAKDALPFVTEVTRLWKSNGQVKAQENNPLHGYIYSYADKMGQLIRALPAEEQLRDGRKFATWQEFDKLSPSQRERYWTIGEQDLIDRKLLDAQEIARERFAAEDKKLAAWAKTKGLTVSNGNNPAPKNVERKAEEPQKPPQTRQNGTSPSVGSQTQTGPSGTPAPSSQPSWMKDWVAIQTGHKL